MTVKKPDWNLYRKYIAPFLSRALDAPEIRTDPPLRFHPEVDDYTMSMGMAQTPGGRSGSDGLPGEITGGLLFCWQKVMMRDRLFRSHSLFLIPAMWLTGFIFQPLSATSGQLRTAGFFSSSRKVSGILMDARAAGMRFAKTRIPKGRTGANLSESGMARL